MSLVRAVGMYIEFMIYIQFPFYSSYRGISTTVDPFRDISLDLAPHSVINRTSTPVETPGNNTLLSNSPPVQYPP